MKINKYGFHIGLCLPHNNYSVGHIRPPAIMAQINPGSGSKVSCYTDIIRLDNTGIMGLSSTPGLAKTLPGILHKIVGLKPIIFG